MIRPQARPSPLGTGVGVGWRPELASGLLADPDQVDLIEVVAESCFNPGPWRRELRALSEIWPVIPHGVKLSLGSACGIDAERARKLGDLARELRAPCVTEHVAFTRSGAREIGHLTQLPMTRAALDVLRKNVEAARRVLPDVPLLLENAAWTLRWPDDEMCESDFYHEVVERTGCDLLLDVGNVYANALNSGIAPMDLLRSYPLERVRMIHLAGGSFRDGFYIDTHAHAVPAPVLELLEQALRVCGPVPILIERDAHFPPFAEIQAEIEAAREIAQGAAPARTAERSTAAPATAVDDGARARLREHQAALCEQLVAHPPPDPSDLRFDPAALARTRAVLLGKRIDEALPLLGHLRQALRGEALRSIAHAALHAAPRPTFGTAAADAARIAERALADPADPIRTAAALDRLQLRARFVAEDGGVRARRAPFAGSEALGDGRRAWALKGPGAAARVHLHPHQPCKSKEGLHDQRPL